MQSWKKKAVSRNAVSKMLKNLLDNYNERLRANKPKVSWDTLFVPDLGAFRKNKDKLLAAANDPDAKS